MPIKRVDFRGSSLADLRLFPVAAKRDVGYQLNRVQRGLEPTDSKSMRTVGKSVYEIRVEEPSMKTKVFVSVWDAIEDSPQTAVSMKVRSAVMIELSEYIETHGLTQAQAADVLGVTQPRISDLMRGKINLFSLDMLLNMASAAGMSPVLKISKPRAPLHTAAKKRPVVTV